MKNTIQSLSLVGALLAATAAHAERGTYVDCSLSTYRWNVKTVETYRMPDLDVATTRFEKVELSGDDSYKSAKLELPLGNNEQAVVSVLSFPKSSAMFTTADGEKATRLMVQTYYIRGTGQSQTVIVTETASSDQISTRAELERNPLAPEAKLNLSSPVQSTMEKRNPGKDPLQLLDAGLLKIGSLRDISVTCKLVQ